MKINSFSPSWQKAKNEPSWRGCGWEKLMCWGLQL